MANPGNNIASRSQRSVRRSIRRRHYGNYISNPSPHKLFFETQLSNPAASLAKKKPKSRAAPLLTALGILVFIAGLGATVHAVLTNRAVTAQISVLGEKTTSADTDNDTPDITKPSDNDIRSYTVAANLPRYIEIPKLETFGRVIHVGMNQKGEIATPKNVHDAAWYTNSAMPGEPGATVINGHISSWTTPGIFHKLPALSRGDVVALTKGDGTVITFQVEAVKTYPSNDVDMNEVMKPIDPNVPGLNIISCTGKVKPGTNEFDRRVIVYAKLKK